MNIFFEKLSIKKTFFICITITILIMCISTLKLFKNSCFDTYFWLSVADFLILLWFFYKMYKSKFNFLDEIKDFKYKLKFKNCFKIILMNIILLTGFICTIVLIIYIKNPILLNKLLISTNYKTSNISLMFNFIGTVILAPFVEEFIFRGVVFNRLKLKYNLNIAIIVSSVLFGIAHIDFAVFGAIFFGIMMCLIYINTQNISVTICIHSINNFIMWLGNFIPSKNEQIIFSQIELTILFFISSVLFPITIFYIFKYLKKNWPNH